MTPFLAHTSCHPEAQPKDLVFREPDVVQRSAILLEGGMFRGFTVPWLVFTVVWAISGAIHIKVEGTTSTIVWSTLADHAYWLREVVLPPLLILAAWIGFTLLDRRS
jgi:hypothetical protein